ncbi:MAG: response regulator [Treponema sp.]|jgi:signal transduction histidine kinase/CheY-like chemotaxis protein|nr:response regulator [Treponema sp.]
MEKKTGAGEAIRQNYRELIFIFVAFALMALVGYFFIGRILRNRLLTGAEDMIYTAEANIRVGLSEAETTLINSYYVVENMVERNASRQEILDYLTMTTEWMRRREQGLLGYYGIYGFINGEFYDSMGLNASGDYIPQRRPWYQTAIRSGRNVAYTAPYEDVRTGDTIISAVRNIDIKDGAIAGILSVDINIQWLTEYVGSLKLSPGGYGMLLNRGMTFIAHPNTALIGSQLQDLGRNYEETARTLRSGEEVFARRIIDTNGSSVIVFFRQIFNGWYVGIVTPYSEFYRDLNVSAAILISLGLVLSLSLCFILLRFSAAKMRADKDSKSKSSFLASMSHEIRTPMNAIIGMAELLLRGELSPEARDHAQDIKHAGNNLVSLINDILDFSKIEAGKLEIISVKYLLLSLINDTVNIVCMRIGEKPLQFLTNIDGNIPNGLIGDEVRLRQILLNLLSNAVKYTEKGHISLTITIQEREAEQIWLKIVVADTGKGIKPEDQEKLFGEFVQVDTKRNRSIEGTGLGLAITRRLCLAMGGNISMESEYGKGSVFTVIIPQRIDSDIPFAAVEKPENKKVLVYEDRAVYAESVRWSLENMNVPYTIVTNQNDFAAALRREKWFYVFSGYGLHEIIKPLLEQPDTAFPGCKKPPLALMVEWGTETFIPNVRSVSLPVQSLSIANVLNGKADDKGYAENSGAIRFSFPHARLLVVDDIATNLKVAEGLLAPYRAAVDTCLNGLQAIEMVQQRDYDLILMDHMMPEMDGIEATAIIRKSEMENEKSGNSKKQIPIIALTANAVVGMREMFIENGFNDFLAKPIDVSKLDEVLDRWIPKEKRERGMGSGEWGVGNRDAQESTASSGVNEKEQHGESPKNSYSNERGGLALARPVGEGSGEHSPLPNIPGIDIQKGISMTGGTVTAYRQVLSLFRKDAHDRLPLLQTMPAPEALPALVTQVHALKSASASLGAGEISAQAAGLEAAGKAGDMAFIRDNLPAFAQQLRELTENIRTALQLNETAVPHSSFLLAHSSLFDELAEALKSQNVSEIDRIIDELNQKPLDTKAKEILEKISDDVLMTEFDSALKTIKELGGNYEQ